MQSPGGRLLCSDREHILPGSACLAHERQLSALFFASELVAMLAALPVGLSLDAFGPRLVTMAGCMVFAAGCLILAASNLSLDAGHLLGLVAMAVGGTTVYIPSLRLCHLFPETSRFVMAAITCSSGASAIVFVLLDALNGRLALAAPPSTTIGLYAVVPTVLFALVTSFYPDGVIAIASPNLLPTDDRLGCGEGATEKEGATACPSHGEHCRGRGWQPLLGTLLVALRSLDFWLAAAYISHVTFHFTHYTATLATMHASDAAGGERPYDAAARRALLSAFCTLLPGAGLISLTAVGQSLQSASLAANIGVLSLLMALWEGAILPLRTPRGRSIGLLFYVMSRSYAYAVINCMCDRLFAGLQSGCISGVLLAVAAMANATRLHRICPLAFGAIPAVSAVVEHAGRASLALLLLRLLSIASKGRLR